MAGPDQPGAALGGQWGAAADDRQAYFGVVPQNPGGVRAVKLDTGEEAWTKPASERLCGTARGCSGSQGAAVTGIPGVVFAASIDGGSLARERRRDDGVAVRHEPRVQTVNGVKAKGGAIDGPGVIVEDGMVYATSGYVSLIGRPGNVLLAFGVE